MEWVYHNKPPLGTPIDGEHPLADFIGYWPMNEGTGGIVNDLSRNGNDGVFVSNPLWVRGTMGHAIDFSDDAINCGANVYNNVSTEMTFVFKMRWDGAGGDYQRIIDKYPGASPYIHKDDPSIRLYCGAPVIDDRWNISTLTVSELAIWAIRLGSNFQECYKNGKLVAGSLESGPYAGAYSIGSGVNAYIGNRASDMARDFDGMLEYLMIYNRALTATEIMQLYMFPFCMFQTDPMELWIPPSAVTGGYMTTNTKYWGT